jgi:hypothetical protein
MMLNLQVRTGYMFKFLNIKKEYNLAAVFGQPPTLLKENHTKKENAQFMEIFKISNLQKCGIFFV